MMGDFLVGEQEGARDMTQQRQTVIKQGDISDVMSRLSELPSRGKDPGAAVSLAEIFRTKEYLAEIKGALKKGYSFCDLAEIFTERCGVDVSARQLKYHYTREKNKRAKNNIGGKPKQQNTSKDDVAPENPAGTGSIDKAGDTETAANVPAIHAPEPAASNTPNAGTQPAETMAFPFEKRQWGN
jgi:hypothetical protein